MEAETVVVADDNLLGQAEITETSLAYIKSMALRAVIMLQIPDVISAKSMGAFLTLDEIATAVSAKNKDFLFRIMRFLVVHNVFAEKELEVEAGVEGNKFETGYGLTAASKWLVRRGSSSSSLAPVCIFDTNEVIVAPCFNFHECILEDQSNPFTKRHGKSFWEFASSNSEFNEEFNNAMVSTGSVYVQSILQRYSGFQGIKTLVDVGGGLGFTSSKIAAAHPTIKCINFDQPHVVENAPAVSGVEHIGGNMFERIPEADAILMKMVLHNWSDVKCVEILKNCHVALPDHGKLIIIDMVIGKDITLNKSKMALDLLMMSHAPGGKERTQDEWMTLISTAGFAKINIEKSIALFSIIEAFKK